MNYQKLSFLLSFALVLEAAAPVVRATDEPELYSPETAYVQEAAESWEAPAENWEAPAETWEVPAESWEVPVEGWQEEPAEVPAEDPITVEAPVVYSGPASFEEAYPRELESHETLLRGIDVSYYQRSIDWAAVKDSGIDFAIVRVAWRGYGMAGALSEDSCFRQNLKGAAENGLQVGAYIFSQATTVEEARQEARYLASLVQGYQIDMPLIMDYEEAGGSYGRLTQALRMWLTKDQTTAICQAFVDEAAKYGYDAMIYANRTMLEEYLNADQLGPVWLANYTAWTRYAGEYELWQFSSSGTVPGIEGLVDLDYWFQPIYRDVRMRDWFFEDVHTVSGSGLVAGIGNRYFGPKQSLLRGQMAVLLYNMSGSPEVSGKSGFQDLRQSYYQDAVTWANQLGIMTGFAGGRFSPGKAVSRQDLTLALYRLAGTPKVSGNLNLFTDAGDVSSYARNAVLWAVQNGLIQGYEDNTLHPLRAVTRAEACAMVIRYQSWLEENT